MSQFPSEDIAYNSYKYRPTGLGFANLGSLLMQMGVPYDSYQGRAAAALLSSILTGESYRQSSLLAKELGAFDEYENNKTSMLKVITAI
jgi:ribonucleoside-diphosphate reductase alpha chain